MTLKEEYYNYLLKRSFAQTLAKKTLFDIVSDLTGRSGLGNAWEEIDEDIQEEVLETWLNIIVENS